MRRLYLLKKWEGGQETLMIGAAVYNMRSGKKSHSSLKRGIKNCAERSRLV